MPADVTIQELATKIGTSSDKLLGQLNDAGIKKSNADDIVNDEEKEILLSHLQKERASTAAGKSESKKITLRRRKVSVISKTRVEVRKKRTYDKISILDQKAKEEELVRLEHANHAFQHTHR